MRSGAKCTNWDILGPLEVTQGHRQRHHSIECTRLPQSHSNRFRDVASYFSKVADFNQPRLHLVPPEFTLIEFRGDLWRQKTRVPGLSCGVVCLIPRLAVLVEHRLVTERHTQTQAHSLYRASISSRGKHERRT